MDIRITLGNSKELDGFDPGEVIALTFAEAKFNSIQQRGGTLSNRFGVEKTPNNYEALGILEETRSTSTVPYTLYPTKVEVDKMPVFYGISIIEEVSDRIYLRLYGDIATFFSQIGDKSIREVDLSAYDHAYTVDEVHSRRHATSGVVYPNINYGRWTGETKGARPYTDFLPAVYVGTILQQAAAEVGYTVNGFDQYDAIPYSKKDFFIDLSVEGSASQPASEVLTVDFPTPEKMYAHFPNRVDPLSLIKTDTSTSKTFTYFDLPQGNYDLEASINYSTSASNPIEIFLESYTTGQKFGKSRTIAPSSSGTVRISIKGVSVGLGATAGVVVRIIGTSGDTITFTSGSSLRLTKGKIINPTTVKVRDTLPDITIKNLFVQQAVQLNALIIVDSQQRTIDFVKMDTIAARIPFAKDWSGKVDYSELPKLEYRLSDFAQLNYLNWLESTEEDPAFEANPNIGRGTISIADEGLEQDKELFASKFAPSAVQDSFIGDEALLIPRYSDASIGYKEPDIDPKPRLVQIKVDSTNIVDITGKVSASTQANATFKGFDSWIEENYGAFQQILTNTKTAEVLLRLDPLDIENLDFTFPVYLMDSYWFIREVKQWKINEIDSTIVKLVRL